MCFVFCIIIIYIFTPQTKKLFIMKAIFFIKSLQEHFTISLDKLQMHLFNTDKKLQLNNSLKKDIQLQFTLDKKIKLSKSDIQILTIK